MAKKVKVTQWNGMPLYNCPYCPHATTQGAAVMDAHITSVHADQIRLDNLIREQRKEATMPGPSEPRTVSGDVPAGTAGARPTTEEKK